MVFVVSSDLHFPLSKMNTWSINFSVARDEAVMAILTINEIEEKVQSDDEGNQRNLLILSQRLVIPDKWPLQIIKNARKYALAILPIRLINTEIRENKIYIYPSQVSESDP